MITATRAMRRQLERDNQRWPEALREIPREQWPPTALPQEARATRVLRSRRFLVQVFAHEGHTRMSVSRSTLRPDGRWEDGITWDELQRLKAEAGYGECYMAELYPADADVVNVGNLRHLWLLDAPPPYAWRKP